MEGSIFMMPDDCSIDLVRERILPLREELFHAWEWIEATHAYIAQDWEDL